jgi:trigger factor
MNIQRQDIDAINATLTIEVTKNDYEEKVEKTLRDYRKRANIPGFRQGMVPASLVKKMYGKAVLAEEIQKIVSDSLFGYIKENNIEILGEPLQNEAQPTIEFDTQEDFTFIFDIAIAPAIALNLAKMKVPYYKIAITDEMVENQVKSYTGRFGSYESVDKIEEKDVVKGDLIEVGNADGIKVEAGVLSPAYMKTAAAKKLFVGKKVGDEITFNPKKAYENKTEISSLLKIKKEEVEDLTANFTMTVTGITRYKESEVNQELFDKAFGEGNVKSEEEFIAKIKENIQQNLDADGDYKFGIDAQKAIIKQLDKVEFPETFLKRWVLATNKELTEEGLVKEFPEMLKALKWHLASDKLAKDNDIKVEYEDIVAFAKKVAQSQFAQYGMNNMPDDVLTNYAQDMLKDEKSVKNMVGNVMHEKVMAIVKTSVKLDEKEISIEDFNKLLETK